jgi:hypothetical protein
VPLSYKNREAENMKKLFLLLCAVVVLSLPLVERAMGEMIVDTGPPPNPSWHGYAEPGGPQLLLGLGQWLAGQFTISQAYDIYSMQGYIESHHASVGTTGQAEVIIFSDNGGLPGTPLFGSFFQPQPALPQPEAFWGWQGTSGYSGSLAAGTYWIAFGSAGVTPDGSFWLGGMGTTEAPSNPMSLEIAVFNDPSYQWFLTTNHLEVRIEGTPRSEPLPPPGLPPIWPQYWNGIPPNPGAVPIPPTVWLFGSGLLGLASWRRLRKR